MNATQYDRWRLQGPDDIDRPYIGSKDGDACNRVEKPDEDAPRGYKPKPCAGVMEGVDGFYVCTICGEFAP